MGNDERRLVQSLDDVSHRERLSGTRDAQQRFALVSLFEALHQISDGLGLIAGGGVFRY